MHGDAADWDLPEHLLAAVVDALHTANWQRAEGNGPPPEPIPRPGVKEPEKQADSMTLDEALDWLGWENELTGGAHG